MAKEIGPILYATGSTIRAMLFESDGKVRDVVNNTWNSWLDADIDNYDIAMTELGTSGIYYADAPTGVTVEGGEYDVIAYTGSVTLANIRLAVGTQKAGARNANLTYINNVAASTSTTLDANIVTIQSQTVTCAAGVTVSPFVGSTGAAINGTNANTLSSHDPGGTLGTSTLTQTQVTGGAYSIQSSSCVLGDTRIAHLDADISSRGTSTLTQAQVTGGAYALNNASFAFASGLDFTSTQKTSLNAATPSVSVGSGGITSSSFAAGAIDASAIATDAFGSLELAASAASEIAAAVAAQITTDHGSGSYQTATGFAVAGDAMTLTGAYDAAKAAASATALAAVQTHGDSSWATATGFVTTSHFDTIIGTPAGASIAADLAEIEAETDGIAAIPTATAIADAVLTRDVANVEGTSPEHSLCYVVLASTEFDATDPTQLIVYKTDGTTPFATKTLTKTAGDDPVRGVS